MSENHHAAAAGTILSNEKAWTVGWETADAQHLAAHIEAQTEATLALAYEQRTANLIALARMEHRNSAAVGFHPDYDSTTIHERLGLA